MCKFWRKFCKTERPNHHFPELSAKNNPKGFLIHLTGCRSALVAVIFANIILAGFYLAQTNLTATYGYQLKSYEQELAKLGDENKKLNLDYIRLQSMEQIASGVQNLNLVPADNIETLSVSDNSLALGHN